MSKEIPEEKVVVSGPGAILAEARVKKGLSIESAASKLNFRVSLIKNIEADIYDENLPDTFNRGYLKNYAKLLNVPHADVIGLYEELNGIIESSSKMQSFSNSTVKKAQNSMLMWITYLILAIFIGLTVMWWLQDDKTQEQEDSVSVVAIEKEEITQDEVSNANSEDDTSASTTQIENETLPVDEAVDSELEELDQNQPLEDVTSEKESVLQVTDAPEEIALTKVIFTFSGDCWVNIYDALGERIAWGIKKTGYVMTIDAKAPLKITIGKPELVEINFGGQEIDMSVFPEGHIAKLTLPLLPQS